MRARRARQQEAGFAMLVVFLLAAFVAISLYMELPRVVFESQRNREQTLIDRGEQYRRAIQLYYRAFQRYPPDLDALDNTNNRRFLRHRYKDPMTDKDEWRLIHAVAPGVFSDSLVYKPPNPKDKTDKSDESAAAASPENAAPNPWMQRRPSDLTLPPGQDQGAAPVPGMYDAAEATAGQPVTGDQSNVPAQPQRPPGFPAMVTGQMYPGQPGSMPGQQPGVPAGSPSQPPVIGGVPIPFGQPSVQPGQIVPVQPGMPGSVQGQPSLVPGQPSAADNPALAAIRDILTRPNPRGLSGVQSASSPQPGGPPLVAGVASNLEQDSIKVYNDRTKYNEWEFIYDPRQDKTMRMPGVQPGGQPIQQTGPAPGVSLPPGPAPTVPGSLSPQTPSGPPMGFPPMGPGGMPQPQRPGRGP